ncbi:MAG TPA: hypothetical protein VKV15_16955 [Bryobacteraceae bacterium]|nr:hypothetical protein [Bryobacteraceae bacterium]
MATGPVNPLLSLLTQPGSPLSSIAATLPSNVLQNASSEDLVSLSNAAFQLQQVDGLFGGANPSTTEQGTFSSQPSDLLTTLEQTLQSAQPTGTSANPLQGASPQASLEQALQAALGDGTNSTSQNNPAQQTQNGLSITPYGINPFGINLYG